MVSKSKMVSKTKIASIDLGDRRCCHCLCNKRGFFTEIDMAFDNFMTLEVPNGNIACRCCCPGRIPKRPILQGRSCACLIRPRQYESNANLFRRSDRCGCNNHIYEDIYL